MPTLFDLPSHAAFIERHSETVQWFRARKCACGGRGDPNRTNVNCLACQGFGYLYEPPVTLRAMIVGVTSRERMFVEMGLLEAGDCLMSCSPYEPEQIRDWDKIIIAGWGDGDLYSGETLVRGGGMVDFILYEVVSLHKVFSVLPHTGAITTYAQGTSFTLNGRQITWIAGAPAPTYLQSYTVDYAPRFEWIAFSPTVHRYEGAENVGQRVFLKRRHTVKA